MRSRPAQNLLGVLFTAPLLCGQCANGAESESSSWPEPGELIEWDIPRMRLVEVAKDNRRVYCWSAALDHYKQPFALPDLHAQDCEFDGLRYGYAQPNQFNFY